MFKIVLQFILLAAATGLAVIPLLFSEGTVDARTSVEMGVEVPASAIVSVSGAARHTRFVGGEELVGVARPGPFELPGYFEVEEGELRLRWQGVELAADEGARIFVGSEGLRLAAGRLRVDGERPSLVEAAGSELVGPRFALWLQPESPGLATLSEVQVDGKTIGPDQGLVLGGHGASPLVGVLRLEAVPGPRPGLLEVSVPEGVAVFVQRDGVLLPRSPVEGRLVYVEGVTPLVRDALGRWAVPGRPSRSLEDVARIFPSAGDRGVLDRLRDLARAAPTETAPGETAPRPLPVPSRAARQRPDPSPRQRSERGRPPRPGARRTPAPEPSKAEEPRDPPASLQVDWTRLGRPNGRVLEGSKQEAPAPLSD